MVDQRVREIIASLEAASRKLHHVQEYVDSHFLSDEEAEEVGRALDKLFDHAEAADAALFESKDGEQAD